MTHNYRLNSTIRRTIIAALKKEGARKIGVFGSYARENAGAKSDLDILVDFTKRKSLLDLVRIERELYEQLLIKIDLCTIKSISPYLINKIKDEEVILYESSR